MLLPELAVELHAILWCFLRGPASNCDTCPPVLAVGLGLLWNRIPALILLRNTALSNCISPSSRQDKHLPLSHSNQAAPLSHPSTPSPSLLGLCYIMVLLSSQALKQLLEGWITCSGV